MPHILKDRQTTPVNLSPSHLTATFARRIVTLSRRFQPQRPKRYPPTGAYKKIMKPAPKYIQEILIREFNIHFPIYNHRQNLDGSTFPEILFNIAADHLISPVKVFQEFKAWMDKHAANFNLQSLLTYNDVFPRFFSDNPSEKWCYNCKKIYPIDGFRRKSEQKVKSRHCCNTCFIQELIK